MSARDGGDLNVNSRKRQAKKLAVERYDFLGHLAIYLLVNGVFVGIWAYEWLVEGVFDEFWPMYPIAIWGLLALAHYFSVYGPGTRWIAKETSRILQDETH
jgi:hypothetical protein